MCGITAIVSKNDGVFGFLFQSLQNLQNRGYDSAGIAGITSYNELVVHKRATDASGTALEKLKKEGQNSFHTCSIGIAHTRWATHGEANDTNSHPHVCYRNKISLVHNGIIENYNSLKNDLISKGITFNSDTDSEVVVNLISYYNTTMPLFKSIKKAVEILQGTWALAIISVESKMLYYTRHGSPLIMVKTDTEIVITSEVSGLYTKNKEFTRYAPVIEGKLYQMTPDSIVDCEMKDVQFNICDVTPHPYDHWTIKEINEQKEVVHRALNFGARVQANGRIHLGGLDEHSDRLSQCTNIILLGCGTSYHAGLVGETFFKKYCRKYNVRCLNAAEFDEDTVTDYERTAVIFLSQSGETRDLIKCLTLCKKCDIITIGVVNVVDSYIARESVCGVYCNAGREVGVASTKSFTAQVLVLILIVLWFNQQNENITDKKVRAHLIQELLEFATKTRTVLDTLISLNYTKFINTLNKPSMFVLGTKGKDTAIAMESSLKIKEICYVHCEGTYTAGLKHGPLALITDKLPVICLISNDTEWGSISNAMEEIKSRNGKTFLIGNHPSADICIEESNEFSFLWNNMALQLIAYHLSLYKGINPDMPRNLAKVVTVG
jgi:glucosamine--fructose-6-phosphate aminotransferase (isomerizing)